MKFRRFPNRPSLSLFFSLPNWIIESKVKRYFKIVCDKNFQDSSVMSKIYDTLGRKYKEKGNEGMQDLGVSICFVLFSILSHFYQT